MATKLLTTLELKAISIKDIDSILNDGGGLRGRVRKDRAGKINIHFETKYRDGKKFRTAKVEQWPKKSLKEIRTIHGEIKIAISRGFDPIETRKAERLQNKLDKAQENEKRKQEIERLAIEAATRRTFGSAISHWEKMELSRRKDGGKETMRAFTKDILPALSNITLIDVKRAMLVDILDDVVDRGARVMANHTFGDLRQFFNFAIAREWIDVHPLAGLTKEKIGGRQNERDRYLTAEEIIELNKRLPSANLLRTTELALWIMLSTCCRIGELTQARWDDVNFDDGEWMIPAGISKNSKKHIVFLSDFTKTQFKNLHAITNKSDWCIPSRNEKKHIDLKSITKQVRDRIRSKPLKKRSASTATLLLTGGEWTIHDLRRTGATMMGELGIMGEVIERCLNHVERNKLKRIYQHHDLRAEKKDAWRLLGDRISLLLDTESHQNILVGRFSKKA